MNKKAKSLLIPIAAFAVTVTGASAFNSEVLTQAGLTSEQITAFEEAREKKELGDKEGARDVLLEAGIDFKTMQAVRESMHEYRHQMHTAIDSALENNDYNAFMEAIADSPMADIVNTKEDYELFKEAHDLKEAGDFEAAREIMTELGFPEKSERGHGMGHKKGMGMHKDANEINES